MRWLGWVLLVLGMALAEPPSPGGSTPEAPPAASSDTQGTEVPMRVLLKRLDEARGVWAFFPRLEEEALAQALWKRARQGKGLVLLFPVEEIHNPLSYSNTFFLGKLVWSKFQSPTEYLELIPVPRKRQMQVGFPELEFARALEHALEPAPRGTSRGRFCRRAR